MNSVYYENLSNVNAPFIDEYKVAFEAFVKKGYYILGENVADFESEYAQFCNSKYCVGVASGLDALIIGIKALDLPVKSEIIVPSNTYIATILAIVRCGHTPVLVEPDIRTYNIDASAIEEKVSSNTRAILLVHLYGKCCDMDPILALSKKYDLHVLEDVAQAHGAKYKDQIAGSFGIGCHSYYPTKNLGALGDAGSITLSDEKMFQKAKALRNYGSHKKYYNEYIGYNSRLDEIQAIFLRIKLKYINIITEHKRKLAEIYLMNLSKKFILPEVHSDFFDVYHIFNIRIDKRDELKDYLKKHDIGTEIHYPLSPSKQAAMKGIITGEYPISDEIHNTTLSLPISCSHSEQDIYRVVEVMDKF